MADTLGPQVPPAPGRLWASDKRRQDRQIRQLQQQRVQIPLASSGGGPVGIVDVLSVNGSVYPRDSGTGIQNNGVTYQEPITRAGNGSWLSASGSDLIVSKAGWYQAIVEVAIGWAEADAPARVDVYTNGGADVAHQSGEYLATATLETGKSGVYRWINRGPTYMGAGDMFSAEVNWGPSSTTAAFVTFGGGFARLNWTITKLA